MRPPRVIKVLRVQVHLPIDELQVVLAPSRRLVSRMSRLLADYRVVGTSGPDLGGAPGLARSALPDVDPTVGHGPSQQLHVSIAGPIAVMTLPPLA